MEESKRYEWTKIEYSQNRNIEEYENLLNKEILTTYFKVMHSQ